MASRYPSRLWARLANCVYIVTCGFCGTPSSALEDAALAEPLLRNVQKHPAASSEAPLTSVLTASQQQPALAARISTPVSKAPPKPATAASRGHESNFGNNDTSGAHADPASAKQTQSPRHARDDLSNLTVLDGQKSRDSPDISVEEVQDSALRPQQVLPFPKLESSQPAQAHGPEGQAPPAVPRQSASSEHSHGEHVTDKQSALQASKGSGAELPVVEQNSKASVDQATATAGKKSSAASSVATAAASPDSESLNQREATPVSQIGAASHEVHGSPGAAAPEALLSHSAAKAVQSKAHVKPSAKEFSVPEGAATKQSAVRSASDKYSAADDSSAVMGDAAKKMEVKSAPEGKRSAATNAAAKQSPVKSSADEASVADKQSAAKGRVVKQSPVRLSAADDSSYAKDTAADQSPVKPSPDEASVADKQSAAKGTVAKQSPVGPSAKEHLAAEERPAATGVAAKQSKGQTPSAADSDQAAVSSSSQSVVQSTSKAEHSQQSTANDAGAVAANESPSATAGPTGTASKPQRRVQGSVGKDESAAGGKSKEQEMKSKTEPESADKDTVDAEKPQPKTRAQGDAVHSATDTPGGASSEEAERGDDPVGEGRLDSSSTQPQVQESPGAPKGPPKGVVASTASSSSQLDVTDASTRSEPQEKLAQTKDVKGPLSAQHSAGTTGHNNGTAGNGNSKDEDSSPSLSGQFGTANTAGKEASRRSNGESQGGGHESSPDPEGERSGVGKHAVITHEGPAGSGPNVAGKPKPDTAKTAGSESEDGDADNGRDAAQKAATGTAQKGTAATDAGLGKKKHNKGKKKKKGK